MTTLEAKAKAKQLEYVRTWRLSSEGIAWTAAYRQTPEVKAREKMWRSIPENKAQKRAYNSTPEAKARKIAAYTDIPIEIPNHSRPFDDRCECCGEISARPLHLDHCHTTGRFRGWCCHGCNTGTGLADNPRRLRLRALYLERPFQPSPINWAYPKWLQLPLATRERNTP
jgi:hypothetical protein